MRYAREVDCAHVGLRVSVRRRLAEGGTTDAVGVLEDCDEDAFGVRDKRGELVRIPRCEVVASRVIRPPGARGGVALL